MRLDNIIPPVKTITEAETKKIIENNESSNYQLLDVRSAEEYEKDHLPGAILAPLPDLTAYPHNLDPQKTTIVYCRSGGRSQAAAQYLSGQGFREVYDISSNIMNWMGVKAYGEYEFNLDIIPNDVDFKDAWTLAYAMEEGLQNFYFILEQKENRPELKRVYHDLAAFEDLHKAKLIENYSKDMEGKIDSDQISILSKQHMEGGDLNKYSPTNVISSIENVLDIFGFSMAIEAQALDLYSRISRNSKSKTVSQLFSAMADEEKQHMNFVAKEMKKYLSAELA